MKKVIVLAAALLLSPTLQAVEIAKEWVKILDAGDTAMVIPENGEIKLLWSSGQPTTSKYIGLVLRKSANDFAMFQNAPADVWARTYTTKPVNLTVNKSTDVSKNDD